MMMLAVVFTITSIAAQVNITEPHIPGTGRAGSGNCCIYDNTMTHCCTNNYTECYVYSTANETWNNDYAANSYNFTCPYGCDTCWSGGGYDADIFALYFILFLTVPCICCCLVGIVFTRICCGTGRSQQQQEQTLVVNQQPVYVQNYPTAATTPGTVIQMQQSQ